MSKQQYRTIDVPVSGGTMRVGIWEPEDANELTPTVLAIHGVTSSHLAWALMAAKLPDVRLVAPDLRGRGRSNELVGDSGMGQHAADMVKVLDAVGAETVPVVGHSMGGFVSVVLAHQHPERVSRLALIDGGLPLAVPPGLDPEVLVKAILGPTAERLARRYDDVSGYVEDFWRHHPAFKDQWSEELEAYIAYDLVPEGEKLRPATSYQTMVEDTVDMNTGTALPEALANLAHPTVFASVPLGLQAEPPGLYPAEYLEEVLAALPQVRHLRIPDLNHYTIIMGPAGAEIVGALVAEEFSLVGTESAKE
jgi:lipase